MRKFKVSFYVYREHSQVDPILQTRVVKAKDLLSAMDQIEKRFDSDKASTHIQEAVGC